ncbi:GAF and ANTAR domain-containing protein [Nocardioides sp. SYSU D00065]|uniref:GAF and ANTAR domain-containing protein n=1 Tax=Nocardioides sp. SYSU D00065 TaxID=2817378 RepID=UPI001B321785|nr:GAF and ANTAR domain-containing protein [Nocardioides sp. SYSU D00065]
MDPDLAEASRRLRAALKPADLDETLAKITAAAVEVLPEVHYASITVKHADGRLETFAPTDEILWDVDATQYELQEGPCYEAAVEEVHVTAPRLAGDQRWPRYAPKAVAAGIAAQAGIRLFETSKAHGALNLYARVEGSFQDLGALGALFSHQAAMAIDYAHEITQLRQAVQTRQLIGQAVGVLMQQYELDEARAFAFLTRISSTTNTKLRVVAQDVVDDLNRRHTP